jgi:hypothetical protein
MKDKTFFPFSFLFLLDPGSETRDPRSGIRDHGSEIRDPRSGIRDLRSGMEENQNPGSGKNIRIGSATLYLFM